AKNTNGYDNILQVIDVSPFRVNSFPGGIGTWNWTASTCTGDSGGPLFQLNEAKQYVLMGILTMSTNCYANLSWVCP
ncbi:hypothetical protein OESDEN_24083, partial [Oesophagostomum dentatum]